MFKLIALALGISAFVTNAASAQCTEDPRVLPMGSSDQPESVRLKSFLCRVGDRQQGVQVKVEFHRLSEVAASMIASGRSTTELREIIGTPIIVENEIHRTYSDLVRQFGSFSDASVSWVNVTAAGGGGHARIDSSEAPDKSVRTIVGIRTFFAYPAVDEVLALQRATIPEGMKYNNYVYCDEPNIWETPYVPNDTCRKYVKGAEGLIFWRAMRPSDVNSYASRLREYNRRVDRDFWSPPATPKLLQLASRVGGNNWPDDFLVLLGYEQTCTPDAGRPQTKDWTTLFWMREILVDVVLIENLSSLPIEITDLLGSHSPTSELRESRSLNATLLAPLDFRPLTIRPHQRLLIPTKITFASPKGLLDMFRFQKTYDALHARFGTAGFRGNARARGTPEFKNYAFGPEIALAGLIANGRQIELARPSANFIDLAIGRDEGSCPYLLSWDRHEQDWVDHGKILHLAPAREREYSELRKFPGFRAHFRLEEREPEVAFIKTVELSVVLKSGKVLTLAPENFSPAMPMSREYLQLYWGEFADFTFSLPSDVSEDDVLESTLSVTGYYERYPSLTPEEARLAPFSPRPGTVPVNAETGKGLFCAPRSIAP